MFRRTLVSELRPPAHRPNWLRPGPYLTLLTHSNLLLRPRRPLLPTTRSNLHVLLLRDPTCTLSPSLPLSPPAPPPSGPSRLLLSYAPYALPDIAGLPVIIGPRLHRLRPVYMAPTAGVFILITMFAWVRLSLRSHSQQRTPNYVDSYARRGTRIFKVRTRHQLK